MWSCANTLGWTHRSSGGSSPAPYSPTTQAMPMINLSHQLDRIEAKLDALLAALAEEGQVEHESEYDLDGLELSGERSGLESL